MDDFRAVTNAAVGAATLVVDITPGDKYVSIYSDVAAYAHKTGAAAATAGFYLPAGVYVGWVPLASVATGGTTEFTITSVSGNLTIVSVILSRG